ncbi:unnamed protein product [Ectocarpus fasciculatus]
MRLQRDLPALTRTTTRRRRRTAGAAARRRRVRIARLPRRSSSRPWGTRTRATCASRRATAPAPPSTTRGASRSSPRWEQTSRRRRCWCRSGSTSRWRARRRSGTSTPRARPLRFWRSTPLTSRLCSGEVWRGHGLGLWKTQRATCWPSSRLTRATAGPRKSSRRCETDSWSTERRRRRATGACSTRGQCTTTKRQAGGLSGRREKPKP